MRRVAVPLIAAMVTAVALAGAAGGAFAGGLLPGTALRVFFIGFVAYMIGRALLRHRGPVAECEGKHRDDLCARHASPRQSADIRRHHGLDRSTARGWRGHRHGAISAGSGLPHTKRIRHCCRAVRGDRDRRRYRLSARGTWRTGLPAAAIGYLYLPAFAGMTAGALLGSPPVSESHTACGKPFSSGFSSPTSVWSWPLWRCPNRTPPRS